MKDIIKETLEEIKKEKIEPTEKWRFTVKNVFIWSLLGILIIFGSISTALIIYLVIDLDWDLFGRVTHDRIKMFFYMIPLFWFFMSLFFLALSFLVFRKTKIGYRYNGFLVGLTILVSIISFGLAFQFAKTTPRMHETISRGIPQYRSLCHNKEDLWSLPELGFLGGEIIGVKNDSFDLKDFQGEYWLIDYDNGTIIRSSVSLIPEEKVKLIGEKKQGKVFKAMEIRPWRMVEGKGIKMRKEETEK